MKQGKDLPKTMHALTEKANRTTIEFLATDLDLGFTFCETARIEADIDPPAMVRLLDKIRTVIDTVARFSPRVEDEAERRVLQERAEKLRAELSELEHLDRSSAR